MRIQTNSLYLQVHRLILQYDCGCLHTLSNHSDPVYSVAFSPDGKYMASGSFDRTVNIWSVKDGELLKTFTGSGGIFEVGWNKDGTQVAACFSTKSVVVVDVRF